MKCHALTCRWLSQFLERCHHDAPPGYPNPKGSLPRSLRMDMEDLHACVLVVIDNDLQWFVWVEPSNGMRQPPKPKNKKRFQRYQWNPISASACMPQIYSYHCNTLNNKQLRPANTHVGWYTIDGHPDTDCIDTRSRSRAFPAFALASRCQKSVVSSGYWPCIPKCKHY